MKFALSLSSILLFIIGILLSFQYVAFSSSEADGKNKFTYSQEIESTLRDNRLYITHHFESLPEGNVTLQWPLKSENHACAEECQRFSEDTMSIIGGENSSVILSYEIVLENGLNTPQLLENIFAYLQNGTANRTTLHITDERKIGGTWLAGVPLVGKKSMERIDYMLFSGAGNVSDLYWHNESLSITHKNEILTLYAADELSIDMKKAMDETRSFTEQYLDIVVTNSLPTNNSDRIMFISPDKQNVLVDELLKGRLKSAFSFNNNDDLIIEILALLMNKEQKGSEKAMRIIEELNTQLSELQKEDLVRKLWDYEGQSINAEVLDKLLTEVFLSKTSFFTINLLEDNKEIYPLLFEEARPIMLNGAELKNMRVIFKDGQTLYAVDPLLVSLGYTTNANTNGFYLDNGKRSFRFPVEEPFYVLNEKRYNVQSEPIEKVGADFFVEERWLILLFLVDIEKNEKEINIAPMSGF